MAKRKRTPPNNGFKPGHEVSPETRARISAAMRGRTRTAAERDAISRGMTAWHKSRETA